MTRENKEEVVEAAPDKNRPKLTLIVSLSIAVGLLLTLLICGSVYHFMSRKAIAVELAATKAELKSKTLLFNDLQTQLTALSKQMHALKDFAVAKAYDAAAATVSEPHAAQAVSSPPPPALAESEVKKPEAVITSTARKNRTSEQPAPPAPEISEPPAKKAKPASLDCQIVGKSPEEQMATLKRCTQAMDGKR